MTDADAACRLLGDLAGGEHRVVAADRGKVSDTERVEGRDDPLEILRLFRRVGARSVEDGAAVEVNSRHIVVFQFLDVLSIAAHQPLKAIADADDAMRAVARFQG